MLVCECVSPQYTYVNTHIYIYIYMNILVSAKKERDGERERGIGEEKGRRVCVPKKFVSFTGLISCAQESFLGLFSCVCFFLEEKELVIRREKRSW